MPVTNTDKVINYLKQFEIGEALSHLDSNRVYYESKGVSIDSAKKAIGGELALLQTKPEVGELAKPKVSRPKATLIGATKGLALGQDITTPLGITSKEEVATAREQHPGFYKVGEFAGQLAPVTGAFRLAKGLPLLSKLPKLLQATTRGAIAGGAVGAGTKPEEGESRTINALISGLLFGGLETGFAGAGMGIKKGLGKVARKLTKEPLKIGEKPIEKIITAELPRTQTEFLEGLPSEAKSPGAELRKAATQFQEMIAGKKETTFLKSAEDLVDERAKKFISENAPESIKPEIKSIANPDNLPPEIRPSIKAGKILENTPTFIKKWIINNYTTEPAKQSALIGLFEQDFLMGSREFSTGDIAKLRHQWMGTANLSNLSATEKEIYLERLKYLYRSSGIGGTYAGKLIGEIKRGFTSPSRLFPKRIWQPIDEAINKEYGTKIQYLKLLTEAEKVGIRKNSLPSMVIFKALEGRATEQELKVLTAEQIPFIAKFQNAYGEIADLAGLPKEKRVTQYATRIIEDALRPEKNLEIGELYLFAPPTKLYNPFFLQRKGRLPYKQDINLAFRAYLNPTLRKAYREPVIEQLKGELEQLKIDPILGKESVAFVNDFIGRRPNLNPNIVKLLSMVRRQIYGGALFGNFASALVNSTQTLTGTMPEAGFINTVKGITKALTSEGRAEFDKTGLVIEGLSEGVTKKLDFFGRVEYWNRNFAYHTGKQVALEQGLSGYQAEQIARDLVRKTQFVMSGADTPRFLRTPIGRTLGQFTTYPIKQTELILGWAKDPSQWNKLSRFLTISYMLGGPKAIMPIDELPGIPIETKAKFNDLVENLERYSAPGLIGVNMAPKFGLGIFPTGPTPVPKIARDLFRIVAGKDYAVRSFVERDLPLFFKGGVALKKFYDLTRNIAQGFVIKNYDGDTIYRSSPKEEVGRMLVGQPIGQAREYIKLQLKSEFNDVYKDMRKEIVKLKEAGRDQDANILNDELEKLGKRMTHKEIRDAIKEKQKLPSERIKLSKKRERIFETMTEEKQ